jgi:hypothetical protein
MVKQEFHYAKWRKSRHCDGGSCVEVAQTPLGLIAVRDNTDLRRPPLVFGPAGWASFTNRAKLGGFDAVGSRPDT